MTVKTYDELIADAKQNVTDLQDSKAAIVVPPVVIPPVVVPPVVTPSGVRAWSKFPTSYAAGNEAEYHSWCNLAFDHKRRKAYSMSWQSVVAALDIANQRWDKLTPYINTGTHNRSFAIDPIGDRLLIGIGTGGGQATLPAGLNSMDLTTYKLTNHPTTGPMFGAESAAITDAARKRIIVFGGWNLLPLSTFALQPFGTSMAVVPNAGAGPLWDSDARKMTSYRTAHDTKRDRVIYVDTDGSLWIVPLSLASGWQHIFTTGQKPDPLTEYVYDEEDDEIVGWTSSQKMTADSVNAPGASRETVYLNLTTLVWSKGPTLPESVPPATAYVAYAMVRDPIGKQTILHTLAGNDNFAPETWALKRGPVVAPPVVLPPPVIVPPIVVVPPPVVIPPGPVGTTTKGKLLTFPMPAIVGAPYSTVQNSKHTNMAHCPLNGRLYVSGGDWVTSATDGTWSVNATTFNDWRQDVGPPIYQTRPAPHALQDGAGFVWVASKKKFLMWPGSYLSYALASAPVRAYAMGMWWFDPITNIYTQELRLFGTAGTSTGCLFGGVYDEVNEHIVCFADDGSCRRWDLKTMTRLPDLPLALTNKPGWGSYYGQGQPTKIGRDVYFAGHETDGNFASRAARMWRWNLDSHTTTEMARPVVVAGDLWEGIEVRLANSNGKVVWPYMNGPEGEVWKDSKFVSPLEIHVLDPAKNSWAVDKQKPATGNFIANSVCSMDGVRVAMAGGVFGKQQNIISIYEAV